MMTLIFLCHSASAASKHACLISSKAAVVHDSGGGHSGVGYRPCDHASCYVSAATPYGVVLVEIFVQVVKG